MVVWLRVTSNEVWTNDFINEHYKHDRLSTDFIKKRFNNEGWLQFWVFGNYNAVCQF